MSERNARSRAGHNGAPDDTEAALLSPEAFTGLFSACLKQASPELFVTVTGKLELETGDGCENPRKAFLDNAYNVYRQNPDARDEVIDGFIASHLDLIESGVSDTIDLQRVVPVVKDKAWVGNLADSLAAHSATANGAPAPAEPASRHGGAREDDEADTGNPDATPRRHPARDIVTFPVPVHESLNSELDVVYAEDSPHNIRYLNHGNLKALGIDPRLLRQHAIENLTSILRGEMEIHGGDGVYLISAGGNYEASFLLFDDFWESGALEVDGDYVVAIPTRDLLLVTGSDNRAGIERVRDVAGDASARGAYALTPVLFVRKHGAFEVFEG